MQKYLLKYLLLGLLMLPGSVIGMEKQEDIIAAKLKMILTSGTRYVYSEHLAIHEDVLLRTKQIDTHYLAENREQLTGQIASYASLLGKVAVLYKAHADNQNIELSKALDNCHQRMVEWVAALESGQSVSKPAWTEFRHAFQSKNNNARLYSKKAIDARNAFEQVGGDTSQVLSESSAAGALLVRLPQPK